MKSLKILLLFLFLYAFITPFYGQDKKAVDTKQKNGLTTVTFNTPNGKVTVTLPEKVHAGDIISGTVIAKPKGKNEKQKTKNKNILNGYVIEIDKKKSSAKSKKIKWQIPKKVTKDVTELILKDKKGKVISKVDLPVITIPRLANTPIDEVDFKIPDYMRAGEPEQITGFYDGNFENTLIKMEGIDVDILAESPEALFIQAPESMEGQCVVEILEDDIEFTGYTNILRLNLSADKLTLSKGETTTIHIEVKGLEDFNSVVPLSIANLTHDNISLEGGNEQHLLIESSDIDADGKYQKDVQVSAKRTGGFSVMVEVTPFNPNYSYE
jgi:hypothetical protein